MEVDTYDAAKQTTNPHNLSFPLADITSSDLTWPLWRDSHESLNTVIVGPHATPNVALHATCLYNRRSEQVAEMRIRWAAYAGVRETPLAIRLDY